MDAPVDMLQELVRDLAPVLTTEQRSKYSAVRGMLATGHDALITSTSYVASQRGILDENMRAIEQVRDETAAKLHGIYLRVTAQDERLESCLEDNLRVLRNFGSTEAQLEELTRVIAANAPRLSPITALPPVPRSDSCSSTSVDELQSELAAAIPSRGPQETEEVFHR
jgi:hypothetical protein